MAGCWLMAQKTSRNLVIHWPVNDGMGLPMPSMIQPAVAEEWFEADTAFIQEKILRTDTFVTHYNHSHATHVTRDDPAETILIKSWFYPCFESEDIRRFTQDYLRIIRQIKPLEKYVIMAKSVPVSSKTYGCHIRIGDWVNNQIINGGPFVPSSVYAFVRDMEFIASTEPDATFYVATEFASVYEKILARPLLSGRIIQWPGKAWKHRTTEQGTADGLTELLILGQCGTILGTIESQYSMLASEWSGTPWIEVLESRPLVQGWKGGRVQNVLNS